MLQPPRRRCAPHSFLCHLQDSSIFYLLGGLNWKFLDFLQSLAQKQRCHPMLLRAEAEEQRFYLEIKNKSTWPPRLGGMQDWQLTCCSGNRSLLGLCSKGRILVPGATRYFTYGVPPSVSSPGTYSARTPAANEDGRFWSTVAEEYTFVQQCLGLEGVKIWCNFKTIEGRGFSPYVLL